jgi:tetratricopeptide (TPR) repeat protein
MRKQLFRLIFPALLWMFAMEIHAQQPPDFKQVDSLSWNYYLAADWDNVIRTGRQARKQDIDYFYLRMRVAYAYFMKQKYRKAIPHYRKALKYNSVDPTALQYLMYSYEYSGRKNDALKFSKRLHRNLSDGLHQRYSGDITQLSLFMTYTQPFSSDAIVRIEEGFTSGSQSPLPIGNNPATVTEDGYQKAPRYFFRPQAGLSHKLGGSGLIAHHQLGYMLRNEFSVGVADGTLYPIDYHRIYQFDYRLGLDYTPVPGITFTPAFHIIYNRIPIYLQGQYGFGKRAPYLLIGNIHEYSYMGSLQFKKEFSLISLGFSGAMGKINRVDQQQVGFHLKFYPLYNLNLYYMLNAYYQNQQAGGQSESHLIHHHLVGFKVAKHLWIEAETILPEFSGFQNTDTSVMYNSTENTGQPVTLRGIVPLYNHNLKIYFGLGYFNASSGFVPDASPLQRANIQNYFNLNITGGLSWNI